VFGSIPRASAISRITRFKGNKEPFAPALRRLRSELEEEPKTGRLNETALKQRRRGAVTARAPVHRCWKWCSFVQPRAPRPVADERGCKSHGVLVALPRKNESQSAYKL